MVNLNTKYLVHKYPQLVVHFFDSIWKSTLEPVPSCLLCSGFAQKDLLRKVSLVEISGSNEKGKEDPK